MTVRLINEISETSRTTFCSACGNQQSVRHVDFDAACDRGYGNDEAVQVALDDLILCEGCLRRGAEILGIEDSTSLKAENEKLEGDVDIWEKRARKAERYSNTLEDALVEQRAKPIKIDHRLKPRKELVANG